MVGFLELSFSWELERLEKSWPYWGHCSPWTGIPLHCYGIWDVHLACQFGQHSVPVPPWGWGSSRGIAAVSSQGLRNGRASPGWILLDMHLGKLGTDTAPLPREKASASANSRNAFDPVGIIREKLCL